MSNRPASGFSVTTPSDREIVIRREFNASRDLVFAAWTKPEHVRNWYGCGEAGLAVCDIDLKVGGNYRYVMRMPDGSEHGFGGTYREIDPPARLVYIERYEQIPGAETLVTVRFDEVGGKTVLTSTVLHTSKENRDAHLGAGMEAGSRQSLDRLADLVMRLKIARAPAKRVVEHKEFSIERMFDATPAQVFAAWASTEAKRGWFANSDGCEMFDFAVDFRVSGREHASFSFGGNTVVTNETVYLDIVPDQRIVFAYTMAIEGAPMSASLATVEFEPKGKRTQLRMTEQAAFLDGIDKPEMRKAGWGWLLDALGAQLMRAAAE